MKKDGKRTTSKKDQEELGFAPIKLEEKKK